MWKNFSWNCKEIKWFCCYQHLNGLSIVLERKKRFYFQFISFQKKLSINVKINDQHNPVRYKIELFGFFQWDKLLLLAIMQSKEKGYKVNSSFLWKLLVLLKKKRANMSIIYHTRKKNQWKYDLNYKFNQQNIEISGCKKNISENKSLSSSQVLHS